MEAEKKEQIIKEVIHCAYVVRYNLGEGFLESVYQNAMMIELSKLGLHVEKEKQIYIMLMIRLSEFLKPISLLRIF